MYNRLKVELKLFIVFSLLFSFVAKSQSNQVVASGAITNPIVFSGSGCNYSWVNNNSAIGLAATGAGNIASFTAVNNGNTPLVATIKATPVPGGFAYIANTSDDNVSVIDITTNTVIKTISVGAKPVGVSVTADGSLVFVSNSGSNSISIINTLTNTVSNVAVGSYPYDVTVSPDGNTAYSTNLNDGTLSAINTGTNLIKAVIPAGTQPLCAILRPAGDFIYVTNNNFLHGNDVGTVTVINAKTNLIAATINLGPGFQPWGLAATPDGKYIYVANNGNNSVSVIDATANTNIATIAVGVQPQGVCVSPDGSLVYVSSGGSNIISVIDVKSNTVKVNIPVKAGALGVSITPDGKKVYVANWAANSVSVIDATTNIVSNTIAVGDFPNTIGNFVTGSVGCAPVEFTITVNPRPFISASSAAGSIVSCSGSASADPNLQLFTVSGNYLTSDLIATAPPGFELSLTPGSGYGNTIQLGQTNGTLVQTSIFVRASALAASGNIGGFVSLISVGATISEVAVKETINELPIMNVVSSQVVQNGSSTLPALFLGNTTRFIWSNDNSSIGLAATGVGNIPSFIAVNNGVNDVISTITVTPLSSDSSQFAVACNGNPIIFTITVKPTLQITTPTPVGAEIVIPNTFTPNNDGVNDVWDIGNLSSYTNATLIIFNRNGQKIFFSKGYPVPWDGKYQNKYLPAGTYYYVINIGNKITGGSVTIIR